MLGSLAKVIGLSLASLGSFNMPTKQADDPIIYTDVLYELYLEDNDSFYIHNETPPENTNYTIQYKEYIKDQETIDNLVKIKWYYQESNLKNTQTNKYVIMYDQNNNWFSYANYMLIKVEFEGQHYIQSTMADVVNEILKLAIPNTTNIQIQNKLYISNQAPLWDRFFSLGSNHTTNTIFGTSKEINYMTQGEGKPNDLTEINIGTQEINSNNQVGDHLVCLENNETNYTKQQQKPYYLLWTTTSNSYGNSDVDQYEIQALRIENLFWRIAENTIIEVEMVDIPGLCFDILTMPFSFISQAFNLTLFPGTAYQINISNLFLSIIGILIFVFIIKKLLIRS